MFLTLVFSEFGDCVGSIVLQVVLGSVIPSQNGGNAIYQRTFIVAIDK